MKPLLLFFMLLSLQSNAQDKQLDTVKVMLLVNDTTAFAWAQGIYGYSVREKHSTSEGVSDPWGRICIDETGKTVPCYTDYWKHIKYLDIHKKPFKKSIIIWQSKEL